MTPIQIAHVVHEANRALQIEQGDPTIPVSPSWEQLDSETADSAIEGVTAVIGGATPDPGATRRRRTFATRPPW